MLLVNLLNEMQVLNSLREELETRAQKFVLLSVEAFVEQLKLCEY